MIKYELKKLFSNKIIAVMLVISVALAVASALFSYNLYGSYYVYDKALLKNGVISRVNINDENVGEYADKTDIGSDYLYHQYSYVKFCTTLEYFQSLGFAGLNSIEELPPKELAEAHRDILRTENGIDFDRSFGWQNLLSSGRMTALPLVLVLLIIVSSAVMFSGEYQSGTDALLMCSKQKQKIAGIKLLTSLIFTTIVFTVFQAITLCSFGAVFSLDGAGADSGQVIFSKVLSVGKAYLLMLGVTLFADCGITLFALAVSSMCKRTLTAAGTVLGVTAVPLACSTFPTISRNFDAVMRATPVTILLNDFNISNYLELTRGRYIVGGQNTLLLFFAISAVLIIISVPVTRFSWRHHKIEN